MSAKEGNPETQQVELAKLNLQQLTSFRKQLDQDLSVFQESLQTLKVAQSKYNESKESLEQIKPQSKGNTILVPLTGSMFVPGVIADDEKVVVDIGTGYYVQMNMEQAKDYFKRRVVYITEQMEKIQAIGIRKNEIRDVIMDVIEMKIQSQLAAQRPAAAKT